MVGDVLRRKGHGIPFPVVGAIGKFLVAGAGLLSPELPCRTVVFKIDRLDLCRKGIFVPDGQRRFDLQAPVVSGIRVKLEGFYAAVRHGVVQRKSSAADGFDVILKVVFEHLKTCGVYKGRYTENSHAENCQKGNETLNPFQLNYLHYFILGNAETRK